MTANQKIIRFHAVILRIQGVPELLESSTFQNLDFAEKRRVSASEEDLRTLYIQNTCSWIHPFCD
jgi:hypothetical protein